MNSSTNQKVYFFCWNLTAPNLELPIAWTCRVKMVSSDLLFHWVILPFLYWLETRKACTLNKSQVTASQTSSPSSESSSFLNHFFNLQPHSHSHSTTLGFVVMSDLCQNEWGKSDLMLLSHVIKPAPYVRKRGGFSHEMTGAQVISAYNAHCWHWLIFLSYCTVFTIMNIS